VPGYSLAYHFRPNFSHTLKTVDGIPTVCRNQSFDQFLDRTGQGTETGLLPGDTFFFYFQFEVTDFFVSRVGQLPASR